VGSYDVLAGGDLEIVGEVITPIHHCVLGLSGSSLDGIRRVLSHPVALAQCTRFLGSRPRIEAVAVYDTAGAAKDVADLGDPTQAAIAGARAAQRYGLDVLAENVEDRPDNQTRFLVVATRADVAGRAPLPAMPAALRKTAIMVETENVPGALLRVLSPFSARRINLSKLESRPAGEPWTYRFFIELDADGNDREAGLALEEVRGCSLKLQLLGTYPRASSPGNAGHQ
jgi:prephenate dehydratase